MTKTLSITEANALKAFQKADPKGKELLSELLGKEVFSQKITDRVKTFEDALNFVSISEDQGELWMLLNYEGSNQQLLGAQALAKLSIIREALNEGWEPNWSNSSEPKYFAWLKFGSGGWAYHVYDYWHTRSSAGSRLSFKSAELAEYAGKQFLPLYSQLFTI